MIRWRRSDGSLWYTGQLANVLGRLDPASGKFTEFHLKTRTLRTARPAGG